MISNFSLISDGVVINIAAGENLKSMKALFPDLTVVNIKDNVRCDIGNYYNKDDGLFYDDEDMKTLSGETEDPNN